MGRALYRKYRSTSFDEVAGQEHIVNTLKNSINSGNFSHAYLFTGPRGVGKTSVARILAFEINNQKYTEDKTFSDILEIDAASNRRIDEIRDLREKVIIAPSVLKYKVYIIDEVHMLTKEAFNALLKTLEEPPEHAIFILATTDFHKVPETIASRCVKFNFKRIPDKEIKKHLNDIAKKEGIKIDDSALELLAEQSDGSFRDAIVLLDQMRNYSTKISRQDVEDVIGLASRELIQKLLDNLKVKNVSEVFLVLDEMRRNGAQDNLIIKQLANYLRDEITISEEPLFKSSEVIELLDGLIGTANYQDVAAAFELVLLKFSVDSTDKHELNNSKETVIKTSIANIQPIDPKESVPTEPVETDLEKSADTWQLTLKNLKTSNSTLYSLARMAKARNDGKNIVLTLEFPFHYKQLSLEKNKKYLEEVIKSLDKKISIAIELESKSAENKEDDKNLENISNIFGRAEVLD